MIERIRLTNFKCLRDVTVDLGALTVLIGPNDSGKTSLLDAIRLLGRTPYQNLTQVFSEANSLDKLVWFRDVSRSIGWQVLGRTAEGAYQYSLSLQVQSNVWAESLRAAEGSINQLPEEQQRDRHNGVEYFVVSPGNRTLHKSREFTALYRALETETWSPLRGVAESFSSSAQYHLTPEAMYQPSAITSDPVLSPNGNNLAAFLDALVTGPDRSAIIGIEDYLRQHVKTISGIGLSVATVPEYAPPGRITQQTTGKAVEFTLANGERPPRTIPAALASEGVLLLTAFLALAYGSTPEILLVEEPENGLHPSRLGQVIELFRKMSRGEVGNRPRQVIVATHSPILLNFVQPEEVRVFRHDREQGVQVTPMDKVPNIGNYMKEFAPSELWYLLGEEKLVEGAAP
jgi:predicted ATPase